MKYQFRPTGKIYECIAGTVRVDIGYGHRTISFHTNDVDFNDYFKVVEEVQEPELIVGKWYCLPGNNYFIKYLSTEFRSTDRCIYYSEKFNVGKYVQSIGFIFNNSAINSLRRATSEELAPLFDAEAKRRGFVKGAEYKAFVVGSRRGGFPTRRGKGSPVYDLDNNSFGYTDESGWVYQIGQWADLIKAVPNYHQQFEDSKYALRNIKKIIEDAEKRVGDFNAE